MDDTQKEGTSIWKMTKDRKINMLHERIRNHIGQQVNNGRISNSQVNIFSKTTEEDSEAFFRKKNHKIV